jgi:hypothetical protein
LESENGMVSPRAVPGCAAVFPTLFCVAFAVFVRALGGEGTLFGPSPPKSECDESLHGTFGAYRGCQNRTSSGKACVSWEETFDWQVRERTRLGHGNIQHWNFTKRKQLCPEIVDAENYCRNPCGSKSGIYCFTAKRWKDDPTTANDESIEGRRVWWEYCNPKVPHACYVLPPHGHGSMSGDNLGYPGLEVLLGSRISLGSAWESNTDFDRILLANFAAVVSSSVGIAITSYVKYTLGDIAVAYELASYKEYVRSLQTYFGAAVVVNVFATSSFMINRCVYHNQAALGVGGIMNKFVYIGSTIFSALFTNALMDRLLFMRAKMLSPERFDNMGRVLKILGTVIKVQTITTVLVSLVGSILTLYAISLGKQLYLHLEDAPASTASFMFLLAASGWLVLVLFAMHGIISVTLVWLLIRVAILEQHGDSRLLIICTTVALTTTAVVYLDWVYSFINLYFLMPVDSVVNDLCLTGMSFSNPSRDLSVAKRVEMADTALAVGRTED